MRAMREGSDSVLTTYELSATADTAGWTMTLPGREPVPVRVVAVAGDSIVIEAGPYPSSLRPGVTVATRGVNRLQGDRMVGSTVARYSAGADSVVRIRTEGRRAP
jgi:hypothetical protein